MKVGIVFSNFLHQICFIVLGYNVFLLFFSNQNSLEVTALKGREGQCGLRLVYKEDAASRY